MKSRHLAMLLGGLVLMGLLAACGSSATATPTPTATPVPQTATATPQAQATPASQANAAPQGFGQSFDQIVQLAQQETAKYGPMKYCQSNEPKITALQQAAFEQMYPKIPVTETQQCQESSGIPAKILLELQAGKVSNDMFSLPIQEYQGFVDAKVLAGPFNYTALGFPSSWELQNRDTTYPAQGYGIANPLAADWPGLFYNANLVPTADRPASLQDCLNPYWNGKVVENTLPLRLDYWGLPEFWGNQKLDAWGTKLAANNPIWVQGVGGPADKIIAGQYAMECGEAFQVTIFHIPPDQLNKTIFDIVPNDLGSNVPGFSLYPNVVAKASKEPNAALLFGAYLQSTPAWEIPLSDPYFKWKVPSSIPGAPMGVLIKQNNFNVIDVTSRTSEVLDAQKKLQAAYGFPTAP